MNRLPPSAQIRDFYAIFQALHNLNKLEFNKWYKSNLKTIYGIHIGLPKFTLVFLLSNLMPNFIFYFFI